MTRENVVGHVAGDAFLTLLEYSQIAVAHLGGYLKPDVQQLAEIPIEAGTSGIMPERGGEFLPRPSSNLGRQWQLGVVDVDHGRVGLAQRLAMGIRIGVDFLGQCQTVAAGLRESDELFEPAGARRLHMHAGIELTIRIANRAVDGKLVASGMDA